MIEYLKISEEVLNAINENKPIVALESTIISHGMPYPKNVETALKAEEIAREAGVVPATICIINGQIVVGASKDEIDHLGKMGEKIAKASRRDLPVLLASKKDGATTVATTMIGAQLAGIKVFATGGIGGVHRGAQETMDISADLEELAQTNVVVVCAGAKSILDIGLTLEYLETKGVPVIGYKTDTLPAFYTKESEFSVDYRIDEAKDIASAFKAKNGINLKGGMLVANPIPDEFSMDSSQINTVIENAVQEAENLGIKGKDTTPYLLGKIVELTGGNSLHSNIQLVYNNIKLACEIAIELNKLKE